MTVTFINDAYGGSSPTDRNLHVDGVSFNGTALASGTAGLDSNGGADFAFTKAAPATATGGGTTTTGDIAAGGEVRHARTWGQSRSGKATPPSAAPTTTPSAPPPPGATLRRRRWRRPAGTATFATQLAFDNFVQTNIDLHAAGTTALDIMLVSAKCGAVTLGDGNDHVTWVAHSDGAGAGNNTMAIKTGAGDDMVQVTAAGISPLADYDRTDNGSLYNATYDGRYSIADVTFGAGKDSVTVESRVRLVLHAGSGAATAVGGGGHDLFDAGTGTGNFTGGAGKDSFVFNAGRRPCDDPGLHRRHGPPEVHRPDQRRHPHQGGDRRRRLRPAGHLRPAGDSVFLAHVTKLAAATCSSPEPRPTTGRGVPARGRPFPRAVFLAGPPMLCARPCNPWTTSPRPRRCSPPWRGRGAWW